MGACSIAWRASCGTDTHCHGELQSGPSRSGGFVEAIRIWDVMAGRGRLSICLATVEHSRDRYAFLVHVYIFVAIPHSPSTHPESVLGRREAPQTLYVSNLSTARSTRSDSRFESFLRSDRACLVQAMLRATSNSL